MAMLNNPGICWICGDVATTGEHSHKKPDVVAIFGDKFPKRVVKTGLDGNDKKIAQGPDSKEFKYQNNLCSKCNNERTQPYDRAYEAFAKYVRDNHASISRELCINMNLVFGRRGARKKQQHLFRYFAKVFGCQLHDAGLPVPSRVTEIIVRENYANTYRVAVCINSRRLGGLTTFPLEGDQDENGNHVDYHWAQDNGWFTVVHAFNRRIPSEWGEEWFGKSKRLVVGKWTDIQQDAWSADKSM